MQICETGPTYSRYALFRLLYIVETTVANRDGGFIGLCQSLTKLLNTIEQKRSCILAFRVFFERKEERIA